MVTQWCPEPCFDDTALGEVAPVAVIDGPRMRERLRDAPDEFFIKPSAIADELWHLLNQDRSAWSFLTELRPFGEKW